MSEKSKAEPAENIVNNLRRLRTAKGLSQADLANMSGVTPQAISAIEAGQYLPTTAVTLHLTAALDCRVEDLFRLVSGGEIVEGVLIDPLPDFPDPDHVRVKVARIGERFVVRPVASLGSVLNYTVTADGLLVGTSGPTHRPPRQGDRVQIRLLRDRRTVESEVVVGGCDPAIFLLGEHLRRRQEKATVVGWTMGSTSAIEALRRGDVHVAGIHVVDAKSGECNLPYLRGHMKGLDLTVVTFAVWEQGLIVPRGNPGKIRGISDLVRLDVTIVNREGGSGARLLLDHQLAIAGIPSDQVKGYQRLAQSHLEVARLVSEGQVDVGIGVCSAARIIGLDFIPLREERYDLVIPTPYLKTHPSLSNLLETIVSRPFRAEIEALGGYDTRDTGKIQDLHMRQVST